MTARAVRQRSAINAPAFSLLELVLVIGIVAVLAAIASPRYASAITRYRAETAANRIVRDLNTARDRAWSTGQHQTVNFTPATNSYTIVGMAALSSESGDYTVSLGDVPYRANISSAVFGGNSTIIFNGYGVPDNGGTVVVQAGDYQYTVTVNSQIGKASIQ